MENGFRYPAMPPCVNMFKSIQINIVHWYLMVVLFSLDYTRNIYDIIYPHNGVYVSTFWAMGHCKSLSDFKLFKGTTIAQNNSCDVFHVITTNFLLGSLIEHAVLLCPMRTSCNFLARAKSNSWPSLHLPDRHPKWPPSSICHLGIKWSSAPPLELCCHQQTLRGECLRVFPIKLLCVLTHMHADIGTHTHTHTHTHTLMKKKNKKAHQLRQLQAELL